MSIKGLRDRYTRRRADVRNATILSRNADGTYQCQDLLTQHEFRAAKANRNDEFTAGTRVVVAPMAAGRISVGGGNVVVSRAPQEQRGVGLFPRGAIAQYTSAVILSIDPSPIQLRQGGASVAATIYGKNLTTAPTYGHAEITDNTAPVVVSTSEITIDIEASASAPLGYHSLTCHGVEFSEAIEVIEPDATINFVAVTNGAPYTSNDGTSWTQQTAGAGLSAVAYGNGTWVTVGSSGVVYSSLDGVTWTLQTAAAANDWQSVCYGNGLFVAVSTTGTGDRVMTSADGITWATQTSAANVNWKCVRWCSGPSLFVAVASGPGTTTSNSVMTSADGATWATQTTPAAGYESVATDGTVIVIVGGTKAATSANGTSWTAQSIDSGSSWLTVAYGAGLFVAGAGAVTTGPKLQTSSDGITWATRTPADAATWWYGSVFAQSKFVMVGTLGTDNAQTSAAGTSWSAGNLTAAGFADVAGK